MMQIFGCASCSDLLELLCIIEKLSKKCYAFFVCTFHLILKYEGPCPLNSVASQRIVVDTIFRELKDYGRSLRHEELEAFQNLLNKVKKHIGSISFSCSYNTWALVLFSILLEQEKELIRKDK